MASFSISADAQKSEFLNRLSRIEAGTGSSKSTLYVGLDGTVMASSKYNAKLKKQAVAFVAKPFGLLAALMSVVVGMLALGTALYLRFALTDQVGPLDNADTTMAINGGMALMMGTLTCYLLRMPMAKFIAVSAIGIIAGVVGFHNLVHIYPSQFADMFSPVWVDGVVSSTSPNSIIWRGQTFVM